MTPPTPLRVPRCGIVPPHLLRRIAASSSDPTAVRTAEHTLAHDAAVRGRRVVKESGPEPRLPGAMGLHRSPAPTARSKPAPAADAGVGRPTGSPRPRREIHDAGHRTALPGALVRREGARPSKDESVNEAYDGLGDTFRLLAEVYHRDSLDGHGLRLVASVHYDRDYANAFWDGEQMVFGDGDGVYFASFTDSVDVIGHELTHGLTQFTAGLTYVGQSGALNESLSDVFGSLTKQHALGQTAAEADWLIGAGIFTPQVQGIALRSMKAPGTAYDDPELGTDPQPASMAGYQDLPHDGANDNGGVHINSGIPNRAFYLVADALGGHAWERAGQVWWDVLTGAHGQTLPKDADFVTFAAHTLAAARTRYGDDPDVVAAVEEAWRTVGVTPARR